MKDYTKGKSPDMLEPFFPNELFRHIIVSCFLVIIELIAVVVFPLPFKLLNKPDHVPWFLLPLYRLNKLVHNEIVFISLIVICALLFVSWPFLVSSRKRNILSSGSTQDIGGGCARFVKERGNLWLWQKPIPFTVVIITIISVIALCFINL